MAAGASAPGASEAAAARVAIADLLGRYAFHFDAHDGAAVAALFVPGGAMVRTEGQRVSGAEGFQEFADSLPPMRHYAGPPMIDLAGDGARARSLVLALRVEGSKLRLVAAGEYEDDLVVHEGKWRIAERRFLAWLPPQLRDSVVSSA